MGRYVKFNLFVLSLSSVLELTVFGLVSLSALSTSYMPGGGLLLYFVLYLSPNVTLVLMSDPNSRIF